MAPPGLLVEICPPFEIKFAGGLDSPKRDFADGMALKEIIEFLQSTARSVGAEITSPWFYLQFGLILTAAGIAWAGEIPRSARGST